MIDPSGVTPNRLGSVPESGFRRLHRRAIVDREAIRALLESARSSCAPLMNGVDRRSILRSATVIEVGDDRVRLAAPNITAGGKPQIYFSFSVSNQLYFFASPPVSGGGEEELVVQLPTAIYEAERRELRRTLRDTKSEVVKTSPAELGNRRRRNHPEHELPRCWFANARRRRTCSW